MMIEKKKQKNTATTKTQLQCTTNKLKYVVEGIIQVSLEIS